ncbi:MAG: hypothetical protein WEB57_06585 [Pseudohongiellaceae bacterium]
MVALLHRALTASGLAALLCLTPASAQEIPRLPDGTPDLSGLWQTMTNAGWNIEPQAADHGPDPEWGAIGAVRPSLGVVQDGPLPYTEEALAERDANRDDWLALDPVVKCYMPGVPRANYMPFPFQIVQSTDHITMAYEFASAMRIIYMDRPDFDAPVSAWMGHSRGHWEDDTLVIRVTDFMPYTWFDHAGNHHSDQLEVIERYTMESPNLIRYQAEIRDPETFTRPWTMEMPLYRRMEDNAQLLEFKCVEFAEELIYGHLSRDADPDREPPRGLPFNIR